MSTPGTALVGYAVLRANFNSHASNYLDNFAPFILSVIAESGKSYLARDVIADLIRNQFGLDIPALVVTRIVRRTTRELLTESIGHDAVGITPTGLESTPAIAAEVNQYRQRQSELVTLFSEFVDTHYANHRSLLPTDVGGTLAEYFERHAVPLLNESLRGKARVVADRPGVDFLVSSFIADLAARDQARLTYVVEAAKGAMLASVLLIDTSALSESLNELTLVLDTPVLMDVLGFHGELPQKATEEVLKLARSQGARLVAFDHSVSELEGILVSISQALRRGPLSRSTSAGYLHFAEMESTPADIVMIQSSLPNLLSEASINTIERPDDYQKYGLDERKLEELIQESVHYKQDEARVNDVRTISGTHRLRRGRASKAFEHSGAVFVTSNFKLVLGAASFETGSNFPIAVAIEALASILWVRSPSTAPDAPKQMLLAAAFAGMQPSAHLWTVYLKEVDRLEASSEITSDQAIVLRSSRFSRGALMEETLGAIDGARDEAPLAVLGRLQRETAEPLEQKVQELQSAAARFEALALAAESGRIADQESAAAVVAVSRVRIRERAELTARRAVRGLAWGVRSILLSAAVAAIVFLIFLPDPTSRIGTLVVAVIGIAAFVVPFFPTLEVWLERWQKTYATKIESQRLIDAGLGTRRSSNSAATAQDRS